MKEKRICGICFLGCHVEVDVENNKIVNVKPDANSKLGNLCPIGAKAKEIIYSQKRIKTPLIRTGEKGNVSFREASWEEALDLVAEKFINIKNTYGAKAVSSYLGRGTLEEGISFFGSSLLKEFGSPNDMSCGSICNMASHVIAPACTLGTNGHVIVRDYSKADTIIIWGVNPCKNNYIEYKRIKEAKEKGALVINIDPRKSGITKLADYWIPIRPGTDGALALGIMNIIISNNWHDREFVDNWTIGFGELKEYVSNFDLDKVSKICGIEKSMILFLAEKLHCKNKVAADFYTGLEYAASGIQNIRSLFVLMAITGNIDNEGGLYIDGYSLGSPKEYSLSTEEIPIGAREYPLFYALTGKGQFVEFPKAVLEEEPYAVKGLIIVGGSPIISYPSTELWKEAYNKLEFMVVADRFMTEECKYADVVLPACTFYETTSFKHYKDRVCLREKSIDPVGESKGDIYIFRELAEMLGYGSKFPKNEKDMLARVFQDQPQILSAFKKGESTIFYDKKEKVYKKYEKGLLRKDGQNGFPTQSGRFEIKSFLLEKYGYEGLPKYEDPYNHKFLKDIPTDKYSLTLTTGSRGLVRENSQYIEIEELSKLDPVPYLDINIEDANNRNIKDGDKILLNTMYGELAMIAHVTDEIGKGIVHAPHGGGKYTENEEWRKTNINSILSIGDRDKISGFVQLKSLVCEVTLDR